jgi:hypothetical protein
MGHPQKRVWVEGHHWPQVGGVVEGAGSEVREQQRARAEVIVRKHEEECGRQA